MTTLRLVVFTVGDVSFGADAEQITAMSDYSPDTETGDVVLLAERLVCRGQARDISPATILVVKGNNCFCRVAVDRVEEIIEIGNNVIRPLPTLIQPFTVGSGIWGVVSRDKKMILLIDLKRVKGEG
ncbi:MAG: chemotaxis protein CheW [Desulfuromonadales bacterium]|nr:chemotaxis protein CheW [Desulfuromonadales bacterium]